MGKTYLKLTEKLGESKILREESLSKYSSFRIGGAAHFLFKAHTLEEIIKSVKTARQLNTPFFLIGGGTNLLIGDRGYPGLVIKNETGNIRLLGVKGKKDGEQRVYIEVESGVSINRLVRFTLDQGFNGLQFFLGQPGTVGGAVYMNTHNMLKRKFFGEMIVKAVILKENGKTGTVDGAYFHFGYDKSILQENREILLSAVIELKRGDKTKLWQEAQETLDYRQKTQPSGFFSSGCTFRNISRSEAIRLATPNYTTSCGYLLDSLGLKGVKSGNAMFSPDHANFIVHRGGAKASDVLKLIRLAQKRVKDKYNIDLTEEIEIVGEF